MTSPVLVVEDDAEFRALVTRMLEGWGFTVITAGTSEEAVRRATEARPSAVVTDVGLPDGDGLDLTRRLIALPERPRVIVISSDASAGTAAAARRAGAVAFVGKDAAFRTTLRRLMTDAGEPDGAGPFEGRRADASWRVSEQATLRRIATLVAEGASPEVVLAAAAQAAAALVNLGWSASAAAVVTILRYDPDGHATVVADSGAGRGRWAVGVQVPAGEDDLLTTVRATARAAVDRGTPGVVGAPIVVDGRPWGAMCLGWAEPGGPPAETERLLSELCGLVATAIANTAARAEADRLAEEQASLRRVATLVAGRAPGSELFEAVAREVGILLEVDSAAVLRLEEDEMLTVVAVWGEPDLAEFVGRRLPVAGDNVAARSLATGRPARIDDHSGGAGEIAAIVRELEIASSVSGPVMVEGRLWGWIAVNASHAGLPATIEPRLEAFAELVAMAIANAENQAQLAASRARVIATADETRRRLQRDLHDGAQQRLVHVLIALQMAGDAAAEGRPTDALIEEALRHAERASNELRDLVHGILPAGLVQGGLQDGLAALVEGFGLPIELRVGVPRMPAGIETAAYFIVAEALTNVVKHAQARRASVAATLDGAELCLTVQDDGVGGADPARGSGLTGLHDRIAANGGTLALSSPPGRGTTLRVTLRTEPTPPPAR